MNRSQLPHSAACERNKGPIAQALEPWLSNAAQVLEVGSGTGQHGQYLAHRWPHLTWQMTDSADAQPGLAARQALAGLANLPSPRLLDLRNPPDALTADAVFAANVVHIVDWSLTQRLFDCAWRWLDPEGMIILYGPFNEDGFTSAGNRSLDQWARTQFPGGGLRELSEVRSLARAAGFERFQRADLPANNLLLRWSRPQP